jgi:hypothetical protein
VCKADNPTTFMCRMSWNLGSSTSWDPQGLSTPATELLYLFLPFTWSWRQVQFVKRVFSQTKITMSRTSLEFIINFILQCNVPFSTPLLPLISKIMKIIMNDKQSTEDGRRANFLNVMYMKNSWEKGQCPIYCGLPIKQHKQWLIANPITLMNLLINKSIN